MAKLSYKEIKAILLIHDKADYSQDKKIKTLLGIVDAKKMLYSPVGLKYRSSLQKIADGEGMPDTCCFCNGKITSGKGVICEECVSKLRDTVVKAIREQEEANRKERERIEKEEAEKAERERVEAERAKKEEEEVIPQREEEVPEEPDEEFVVSTYDPESIAGKRGRLFFVIFLAALIIIGSVFAIYRIVTYRSASKAAQAIRSESTELYSFVGGGYSELSRVLGKSQAVVDESIRFFDKSCMTVMYDPETFKVTYMDQDGQGPLKTTLFGVRVGMTKEEVKAALSSYGLKKPVSDADNTLKYEYKKGQENPLELAVSFVNDKVEQVSVQLKKQ